MTSSRRVRVAALLTLPLVLTGCTSGPDEPPRSTSPAPGSGTPTPSPASPASPASTHCPATAATIPDGTWDGPLTLDVTGVAGVPVTTSSGSGELHAVVQGGQVVQGTWKLAWHSVGQGVTDSGQGTVTLDAEIAGNAKGPAAGPVLFGAWTLSGKAEITEPVTATVPIAGSGESRETMTVEATGCDRVTGTFVPSFRSKRSSASLGGTAHWVGRRVG